jgi:4'-phosphopantetheinyl transferase
MRLPRGEVHCWTFGLDIAPDACAALSALLSRDERSRSDRLRDPRLRRRFVAAHGALRTLLGGYLAAPPAEIAMVRNAFGKPALGGPFADRLRFNLSHSGDLALIGLVADADIGVDLEEVRDEPDFIAVAERVLAATEVERLNRLPTENRSRAFLRRWTALEAAAKARGEGLGELDATAEVPGWSQYELQPAASHVGAVVVRGSGWRVRSCTC